MTDQLHEELQERLGRAVAQAAMDGDPLFGTVTLTINELAELLELRRPAPVERETPPR
ncbi:hypothetical protein [Rhodococcus opacus]|uniref:hypothetical protein n=1 Tax=Rhodococcus opacus TaxID=37919 RepID=UPI001C44172A|nr:hypothetical protein [Rhodococcus opacus]MBV6763053.1 hypothetical protein [Rhodococcus opacus]